MPDDLEDKELEGLLKRHYGQPGPRPEFVGELEAQLVERLRQRPAGGGRAAGPRLLLASRTWRRAAIFAAAAVLVVAASAALMLEAARSRRAAAEEQVARLQAEFDRCEVELRLRAAGVERMLARERRAAVEARLARALATPDPLMAVAGERERAAAIMLASADRMYREMNLHSSAIATYRRAVALFPGTQGAVLAQERLTQIQSG